MIVVVTGSRDWPDQPRIRHILDFIWACCCQAGDGLAPEALTVRHGANGNADSAAHFWATEYREAGKPISPDSHPAKWHLFGKAAGGFRNQEMFDPGDVDLCVGFSYRQSRGTADCVDRARTADVPVWFHSHGFASPPPPAARLISVERWRTW